MSENQELYKKKILPIFEGHCVPEENIHQIMGKTKLYNL